MLGVVVGDDGGDFLVILRPHQVKFRDDARFALRSVRSVLGVAACGFGKGVVMQNIIMSALEKKKHVLMLVHGRDRVNDAIERATKLQIPHGVLMAGTKRQRWHQCQLASSDTVYRMDHRPLADVILVDEAHLAMSKSFREVLSWYPDAKILGFTATPCLGNNKPLGVKSGGIFEAMVKGPSVKQLIREGYLVGSEVIAPPPPSSLSAMKKKRTGEYDENEGAAICDNSKIIGDVVDNWKRYASDRKPVAFGFNQAHAFHISEQFNAAGVNFAYIDASTPDGDIHTPGTRKFIFHQFDHGDLVGISSCRTISLGWDHSIAKVALLCRKIGSFPEYHQVLGRCSRPHKGYDHFRVHDHTGCWFEHADRGPDFESDIDWQLDGEPSMPSDDEAVPRLRKCDVPVKIGAAGIAPTFRGPTENGYMLCCMDSFKPNAGTKVCPYCGIPLVSKARVVEQEAGELQEITPAMRAAAEEKIRAESGRKAEYLDLMRLQKERGWKPAYAATVFRSRYNYWPPKGWKAEIEAIA